MLHFKIETSAIKRRVDYLLNFLHVSLTTGEVWKERCADGVLSAFLNQFLVTIPKIRSCQGRRDALT